MATQPGREQLLAIGYAIFLAHGVQPGGLPGFVQSLDDESGHTRLELIGVRLEPAMLGLHESESKGVEGLLCAQPNEATLPGIDIGFVGIGVARAHPDRKSVVEGRSVAVRLELGGRRMIKKKKK